MLDEFQEVLKIKKGFDKQLSSQVWEMMKYQKIKEDVVTKAIEALVTMHDLDYERLWQNLNRTDRFTLKQLVMNRQPMQNGSLAASTSYSSLLRMMKSGIVMRNIHYEVEDPFFRQWICQNKCHNIPYATSLYPPHIFNGCSPVV